MTRLAPRMDQSQIPIINYCTAVLMAGGEKELSTQVHGDGEGTHGISVMRTLRFTKLCAWLSDLKII